MSLACLSFVSVEEDLLGSEYKQISLPVTYSGEELRCACHLSGLLARDIFCCCILCWCFFPSLGSRCSVLYATCEGRFKFFYGHARTPPERQPWGLSGEAEACKTRQY